MATARTCRVCVAALPVAPRLRYRGMPRVAQNLPTPEEAATDSGVDLEVYQCPGCGLVQLGGAPAPYYREVIRATGLSEEMRGFRLEQFNEFVGRHRLEGKPVVEVGCGNGDLLAVLAKTEAQAVGLEHSEASVAHCRSLGLEAHQGFVESADAVLPRAPYQAFLMLNFLEHLPDPRATLLGIAANLADGGVGLVEVPNFDMILRERHFAEFTSDHLLYFTKQTLTTTLGLAGFEVLECHEAWYQYVLSATVSKRPALDLAGFREHQDQIEAALHAYVARYGRGRVAVWGAGHQALALIALSGIGPDLRYVVDSAPFKQGRLTPATHVPIVAPQALGTDPVAAVIVMAGGYSDEVARLLRKVHGGSLGVAILRPAGLEVVEGMG